MPNSAATVDKLVPGSVLSHGTLPALKSRDLPEEIPEVGPSNPVTLNWKQIDHVFNDPFL